MSTTFATTTITSGNPILKRKERRGEEGTLKNVLELKKTWTEAKKKQKENFNISKRHFGKTAARFNGD